MNKASSRKEIYIDERLFDRIHLGEQEAFRELYEIAYRPLYAFLLSLTQNSEDAMDLLQDTFVQIRGSCHLYKKQGKPMAWIMTIARNLFLMKCRKERQVYSYDEVENELGLEVIVNLENKLLLEKMFDILSDEERNVILMHDVIGLKNKEIAQVLEKPVGTILAKYNRAIRKLRKEFGER